MSSWGFAGLRRGLAALLLAALVACSDDSAEQSAAPAPDAEPVQQVTPVPIPPEPVVSLPESLAQPIPDAPVEVPVDLPDAAPDGGAHELPVPEPLPAAPAPPRLAVVIDDVGQSLTVGRRVLALPGPVALAILPQLPHSQTLASEAAAAGKPVMLHLPMENMAGLLIGPGGLTTGMTEAEFRRQLQQSLNAFGPIQGVNNHMGSLLSSQRRSMKPVLELLRERDLYFLDSRTSPRREGVHEPATRRIERWMTKQPSIVERSESPSSRSRHASRREARRQGHPRSRYCPSSTRPWTT